MYVDLCANFELAASTTVCQGISEHLAKELTALAPSTLKFKSERR